MTLTTICHVHGHVQVRTKVSLIFTIYGKKTNAVFSAAQYKYSVIST